MSEHAMAASSQAAPSSGKSTSTSLEWAPKFAEAGIYRRANEILDVEWLDGLECVVFGGIVENVNCEIRKSLLPETFETRSNIPGTIEGDDID